MNDRYLFRAKRIDNGEWVEGGSIITFLDGGINSYYMPAYAGKCTCTHDENDNITSFENCIFYKVDQLTICQCTGLKGIYEWDVFECDGEMYQIVFDQDDLVWWADGYGHQHIQLGEFKPSEIRVIGNIFDNPELMEQEG